MNNSVSSSANSSAASAITFPGSNDLNINSSSRQTSGRRDLSTPTLSFTILNVDNDDQDDGTSTSDRTVIDVEVNDGNLRKGNDCFRGNDGVMLKTFEQSKSGKPLQDLSKTQCYGSSVDLLKKYSMDKNRSEEAGSGFISVNDVSEEGNHEENKETSFIDKKEDRNHEESGKDDGSCNYIQPSEIEFNPPPSGISTSSHS